MAKTTVVKSPSFCTSGFVSSQGHPLVVLISVLWHSRTLCHEKVQLLVQGICTGARAWTWVCHVVGSGCAWLFALEAHCLEDRPVHCAAWSRYKESGGMGSRVGCQGLVLGEVRCVGLCADSGVIVH
jgi:hypothetical protein